MMKFNRDISGIFKDAVLEVSVGDWLAWKVAAADTEHHLRFREHLQQKDQHTDK